MALSVLLVGCSEAEAHRIVAELRGESRDMSFARVATREELSAALIRQQWDAIIADCSDERLSPLHALALMRERGLDLPFIVVCDAVDEATAVTTLRAGAHDFIAKGSLGRLNPALEREIGDAAVRAEARLNREREFRTAERLRLLMESLPDPVIAVDEAGTIVFANAASRTVFGYGVEELVGHEVEMLLPVPARHAHAARRASYATHPTMRPMGTGLELVGRRKDGTTFPVEVSLSPAHTPDGLVVTATVRDLTVRRASEAQLRQAQKMEAIGQLTGGIAHDFNNILTVIIGNTELAQSVLPPGETIREQMDDILSAARRGATMVGQLLRFSRRAMLRITSVDPREIVNGTTGLARRLLPESIEIRTRAEECDVRVRADTGAIEQVLLNLCTNARDAMPDGGTLLLAYSRTWLDAGYHATHPWVEPGEYVCLSVTDTGVGMDEATKQRIFEPFFTTKAPGSGTGLGMAMVYGLMKQHRGMVHVYSEVGEGTEVKLYLPVDKGDISTAGGSAEAPLAAGGTETILLAEDDIAILRATRRALESRGYTVLAARDGEEALDLLLSSGHEIALVISDLVMPKLGGRQLAEEIRSRRIDVGILFTSGYSPGSAYREASFPEGIQFLHKPWTLADLFATVRSILDRPRGGAPEAT